MLCKPAFGLLLGGLLWVWAAGPAEEASVRPGINSHYHDPDYEHWVSIFESRQ